ncbi:hypothetical protein ACWNX6_00475 [Candidatus Vidania fulgoroideorum]
MLINLITETGKIIKDIYFKEAIKQAKNKNLDLIKVLESKDSITYKMCKIKFKKNVKKKTVKTKIIKFSIRIFENDYINKINFIKKKILKNNIKIVLELKGREKGNKETINIFMEKILKDLENVCPIKKVINEKMSLYSLILSNNEKKNK